MRVAVEWTDRSAPWTSLCIDGRDVQLAICGLLELARAVDTALDHSRERSNIPIGMPEQENDPTHVSSPQEPPAGVHSLAGASDNDAANPARRLGNTRPQGPSRRISRRGGKP
jgi:hypothetical protein